MLETVTLHLLRCMYNFYNSVSESDIVNDQCVLTLKRIARLTIVKGRISDFIISVEP